MPRLHLGLIWICCLLLPLGLMAQQPGYFILGEAEFKGLQVYDVIQDARHDYLFSTNEGIYVYDYNDFRKIGCAQAKSTAVFNFVKDSRGVIYCSNINHQVFRIEDQICQPWYELLPDEVSADVSLAVGQDDMLLVAARKVIAIARQGHVVDRVDAHTRYWGLPYTASNGSVFFHLPGTDTLLRYDRSGFHTGLLRHPASDSLSQAYLSFFDLGGLTHAVDQSSKRMFQFDIAAGNLKPMPGNAAFARSKSIRIYSLGHRTWIAGTLPGTFLLDAPLGAHPQELWFENAFISDVYLDHEGNWLLSTFDKGVLVVPNLEIPDVIQSFRDDPITALYADAQRPELYLGSSKGRLLRYRDRQIDTLSSTGMRAIESIHGAPGFPYLIYDDGGIHAVDRANGAVHRVADMVLKDALVTAPDQAFFGTNLGLYHCQWDRRAGTTLRKIPGLGTRVHFIESCPASSLLIVSTSVGLYACDSLGDMHKVLHEGQDIFPTAMHADDERVYAATQNGDILVIQGDRVTATIHPNQTQHQILRKLVVRHEAIWAKSSHAIYQFGKQGELLKNISRIHGFPDSRIYDFLLLDSLLWVSHARGVQAVDLRMRDAEISRPQLRLDAISANGASLSPAIPADLPSGPTKIQFQLSSPTLRNKESLRFQYILKGYDSDWTTKPNDGRDIVYNALAPGNYTFEARAENEGRFSPTLSYSFAIATPIHARGWFVGLAILLGISLMAVVFGWQLRRQRKKAQQINELNASKLTAIQSQMNPHFIFNALNSIQDLVLKGDVENSYSYITTFSNLVRSTLLYSDRDFIDFDDELKLLQLYLQLEQLRFKNTLACHIEAEGIEDIQIPPLLIQPFVENALLHGLLHQQGSKVLHIRFTLGDALTCTIQDNGIGRAKARAIRERQRSDHESFSGKAIRKRFDILSEIFQGQFGYTYEDLQEDGQATGTRVTLRIPIRREF